MNDDNSNKPETVQWPVQLVSEALVKCQGQIKAAEFDATNPFFKSKYATLGSVIAASREALFKADLAILQVPSIEADKVSVHTLIIHSSGQSLDGGTMSLPLEGNDRNSDAQVAGSILTYLKRYAWASVLGIYADSDDDGHTAPKGAIPRQNAPGRAAPAKPPTDSTQAPKVAPEPTSGNSAGNSDENTKKWNQIRLKFLNKLEAAPGQRNRVLLTDYLTAEGVLTLEQTLDELPTSAIPLTDEAFKSLLAGMQDFDMRRNEVPQ